MLAALTLLIVLTLAILVVRAGAVALRLTGIPPEVARFQARSAFTGAGFTTSESEAIVNHPVRRRIVSTLMVVGSVGLVSVVTTVIVSLVGVDADGGLLKQLFWLGGALVVLWCVALNPKADRIMCAGIAKVLERSEGFGARAPLRLLQMPVAHGIVRIHAHRRSGLEGRTLRDFASENVTVLGVAREDGTFVSLPDLSEKVQPADEIFVYGPDDEVDTLHEVVQNEQRAEP